MDQEPLPKKLSLSKAASKLRLGDLTHDEATKLLLQFNAKNQLPIFLATSLYGYRTDQPRQQDYDPDGCPSIELIEEDVTTVSYSIGSIRLLTGYFEEHQEEPFYISVSSFHQNGIDYDSVNDSKFLIYPVTLIEDCFYIVREDLQEFISTMGEKLPSTLAVDYKEPSNKPRKDDKNLNDVSSNKFLKFHSMEGLLYEEITVSFLAGDMVELIARDITLRFTYEMLSLRDMRRSKITELNSAGKLLQGFMYGISQKSGPTKGKHKDTLKMLLNKWFGLKCDPFNRIGEMENIYDPRFKVVNNRNRADIREKSKAILRHDSLNQQDNDCLEKKIYEESNIEESPDFDDEDDDAGKLLRGEEY